MPAKTPILSDGLQLLLQKALNVLKGNGSTSFMALAATIALKRTGFSVEQALLARNQGHIKSSLDSEVALAFHILSKHFNGLSDEKLVQLLDVLELPDGTAFSNNNWGLAFDICLEKYKPTLGKKAILSQPRELAQLVASVYTIEKDATVYSPFSGACCLAQYIPEDVHLTAQELQDEEWAVSKLRLAAYGSGNSKQLSKCNPLTEFDSKLYDYILSFPPFVKSSISQNPTIKSVADAIIEQCLPAILHGSKAAIVVPYWFLSAEYNRELRKQLVENDLVESVTYLPGRIYAGNSYSVALLCLNKQKKNQTLFFDADQLVIEPVSGRPTIDAGKVLDVLHGKIEIPEAKYISTGMVKKRNYSLNPSWHLLDLAHGLQEADHLVRLETVATIITGGRSSQKAKEADRVLIMDLSEDTEDFKLKHQLLKPDAEREDYANVLNKPCLLVALAWRRPKPTWFKADRGKPICIGDEICALKIDTSKVDIAYLVSELRSDFVTHQFSIRKGGMHRLFDDDLLRLQIRLPALEEQRKKVMFHF
jgi:type I restriction-modification system DNA methylase subunit